MSVLAPARQEFAYYYYTYLAEPRLLARGLGRRGRAILDTLLLLPTLRMRASTTYPLERGIPFPRGRLITEHCVSYSLTF